MKRTAEERPLQRFPIVTIIARSKTQAYAMLFVFVAIFGVLLGLMNHFLS